MWSLVTKLRHIAATTNITPGEVFCVRIKGERKIGDWYRSTLAEFIHRHPGSSVGAIDAAAIPLRRWLGLIDDDTQDCCLVAIEAERTKHCPNSGKKP